MMGTAKASAFANHYCLSSAKFRDVFTVLQESFVVLNIEHGVVRRPVVSLNRKVVVVVDGNSKCERASRELIRQKRWFRTINDVMHVCIWLTLSKFQPVKDKTP